MPSVQIGRDDKGNGIVALVIDESRNGIRHDTGRVAVPTVEDFPLEHRDRGLQAVFGNVLCESREFRRAE